MFRSPFLCRLAAALLLAPTALATAQDVASILNQKALPEAIKIAELPEGFKAVKIKVAGVSGGGGPLDMFGGLAFMFLMSLGGSSQQASQMAAMDALGLLDVSWTRGETLKLAGSDFLITYKTDPNMSDLANLIQGASALANAPLRLTLVKVADIQSLSPRNDLSKETFTSAQPANPGTQEMSPARQSAARTATLSNAKQIALGLLMYCSDYDDVLPWPQSSKSAWSVIDPYLKNRELYKTLNPDGGEFRFNMCLGGVNAVDIEQPADTPLIYESKPWPDGKRIVAYTDGHAKVVSPEEWAKLEPMLKLKLKKTAKRPLPLKYDPAGLGT